MNDYSAWKKHCAEHTCDKVLKTIDHIIDEANGHLDGEELDRLKDCWKILHYVHYVHHEYEHEHDVAPAK